MVAEHDTRGRSMPPDQLYFEPIQEPRGGYYVKYHPAHVGDYFASIVLTFPAAVDKETAAQRMEAEMRLWLSRYSVPVMVAAFDESDTVIQLQPVRPCEHLFGVVEPSGGVRAEWRMLANEEFPAGQLSAATLVAAYADVPYRTQAEINASVAADLREQRVGWAILWTLLFVWAVIVPAGVALVGWASPVWGLIVLAYALLRAGRTALRMTGHIKPTAREREDADKQAEMEHFYYHCKLNPDGFLQLKAENLEQDARVQIQEEAEALGVMGPDTTTRRGGAV